MTDFFTRAKVVEPNVGPGDVWAGPYRGVLIVAPAGSGKTTLASKEGGVFRDADAILAEEYGWPDTRSWQEGTTYKLIVATWVASALRVIVDEKLIVAGAFDTDYIPPAAPVVVCVPPTRLLQERIVARDPASYEAEKLAEHVPKHVQQIMKFAAARRARVHTDIEKAARAAKEVIGQNISISRTQQAEQEPEVFT